MSFLAKQTKIEDVEDGRGLAGNGSMVGQARFCGTLEPCGRRDDQTAGEAQRSGGDCSPHFTEELEAEVLPAWGTRLESALPWCVHTCHSFSTFLSHLKISSDDSDTYPIQGICHMDLCFKTESHL